MRCLWVLSMVLGIWSGAFSQNCPDLINPLNGASNVPVDTVISWESVEGVTGYIISIGITPGGSEIIDSQPIGSSSTFVPPVGLPENTLIYVTITLFYFNLPNVVCISQSFTTEDITSAPGCSSLNSPMDSATDVNIGTNLSWDYAVGATGYILTIGTAPGLGDIVLNLDVGNVLFYNPPDDFPTEIQIFIEIIPYNENGSPSNCGEQSFTTGTIAALPVCSNMIFPPDGAINVALSPLLEWEAVPGAVGYFVYIGTTPFDNDVLDGGVFNENFTFVINFQPNRVYFIRVVPFNAAGQALGCAQTSFSTILGCGPFLNPVTGELETLYPDIDFPDQVGICLNEGPTAITATDEGDGYRWYMFDEQGEAILISEEITVEISETGMYMYEVYIISDQEGIEIECSNFKNFEVVSSEIPAIEGVNLSDSGAGFNIEVIVSGIGDYEYSIESAQGPYQSNNVFLNISPETTTVYVRDRNGCGIVEFDFEGLVVKNGFPRFFTPNNDGINDDWRFIPGENDTFQLTVIYIFNRFGKLLKTLNPYSDSWNGNFNGELLPVSDYWYKALTTDGRSFTGHFTLKR